MIDTKIYLVTYTNKKYKTKMVSHGIGNNTLNNYVLPDEPLSNFSPKRDTEGYYIEVDNES